MKDRFSGLRRETVPVVELLKARENLAGCLIAGFKINGFINDFANFVFRKPKSIGKIGIGRLVGGDRKTGRHGIQRNRGDAGEIDLLKERIRIGFYDGIEILEKSFGRRNPLKLLGIRGENVVGKLVVFVDEKENSVLQYGRKLLAESVHQFRRRIKRHLLKSVPASHVVVRQKFVQATFDATGKSRRQIVGIDAGTI